MKTLTIDEALERLADLDLENLTDPNVRAILNDFARGQWEAAASHIEGCKYQNTDRLIRDEADRRFPTTNPTQAGTMTDGPCGTCDGSEVVPQDDGPTATGSSRTYRFATGKPCPDCKPSAPDTKGDPE